ncbi:MAG: ROK family protein, partial [Aerococcus sp.]|nr:ROK family protein [Aerococcus sp.]
MAILCIDIGGTAIKYNILSETGEPIEPTKEVPTGVDNEAGTNHILDQVYELIEHYGATIEGVAIASAGVVDPKKGEITYAGSTIPDYIGTNFKTAIKDKFGLPCSVENDVSCMGYAENWRGKAKDAKSAVCLTLGTGIGGAVFIDGEMWHGVHYTAG